MTARTILAIAYALLAIPICFLLTSLIWTEQVTINSSRREISGNAYLASAAMAQRAILEASGTLGPIAEESSRPELLVAANSLEQSLSQADDAALTALSHQVANHLRAAAEPKNAPDWPAMKAALRALITAISDRTGLILDTQIESFYAVDMIAVDLPGLLDLVADGGDPPTHYGAQSVRPVDPVQNLLAVGQMIAIRERLESDMVAIRRGGEFPNILKALEAKYAALQSALDFHASAVRRAAESQAAQQRDANDLSRADRQVMDNIWQTQSAAQKLLDTLLHARIKRLSDERWTTLAITIALFAIVIAINIALIRRGVLQFIAQLMARRELSEAAVKASERSLRAMMDHMVDGVMTFDQNWTIRSISKPAEQIFGYEANDVIGRKMEFLIRPYEEEGDSGNSATHSKRAPGDYVKSSPSSRDRPAGEYRGFRQDGSIFAADFSVAEIAQDGDARQFVGTVRDITDKKHAEIILREAQKMQALSNLSAGIAHNFNNILGTISGFGEFLCEDLPIGTEPHNFAERIVAASKRGRMMVQQISDFSTPKPIRRAPHPIMGIIAEAQTLLIAALPSTSQILIRDETANTVILVDRDEITQLLVILCTNASHALEGQSGAVTIRAAFGAGGENDLNGSDLPFTPPASPHGRIWRDQAGVTHYLTGDVPDGPCVSLTVSGDRQIDASILHRIFEPFSARDADLSDADLGLTIAHRIVVSHDGAVVVGTRDGIGVSFKVILPIDTR